MKKKEPNHQHQGIYQMANNQTNISEESNSTL
jgi:hypothetical protein